MTLSVTKDSKPKLVGIGISLLFTLASSSISHTNSEYYQFRGLERSVSTSPALPTAGAAQGADTGPTGIASVERQSGIGRSWTIATAGGWDYRKFRSQVGKVRKHSRRLA